MSPDDRRQAVARWVNYQIHDLSDYHVEAVASCLGMKEADVLSLAQDIVMAGAKVRSNPGEASRGNATTGGASQGTKASFKEVSR